MKFKVVSSPAKSAMSHMTAVDISVQSEDSNIVHHAGQIYMKPHEAARFLEVLRRGSGDGGKVEIEQT